MLLSLDLMFLLISLGPSDVCQINSLLLEAALKWRHSVKVKDLNELLMVLGSEPVPWYGAMSLMSG